MRWRPPPAPPHHHQRAIWVMVGIQGGVVAIDRSASDSTLMEVEARWRFGLVLPIPFSREESEKRALSLYPLRMLCFLFCFFACSSAHPKNTRPIKVGGGGRWGRLHSFATCSTSPANDASRPFFFSSVLPADESRSSLCCLLGLSLRRRIYRRINLLYRRRTVKRFISVACSLRS